MSAFNYIILYDIRSLYDAHLWILPFPKKGGVTHLVVFFSFCSSLSNCLLRVLPVSADGLYHRRVGPLFDPTRLKWRFISSVEQTPLMLVLPLCFATAHMRWLYVIKIWIWK